MGPLVETYDEFRVRLDRQDSGRYRILATTRSAEASSIFEPPFSALEIENFILRVSRPRGRRRIETSGLADARRFGAGLFKALFREQIHTLYRDTLSAARAQGRGVRITLCLSGAPELIDVPWEYLYDDPDFLAVSAFTPVVRYLDLPRAHRPLMVKPPLRLLGVVSSPADYEQLDVERERENLRVALSSLTETGAVELHWLQKPTLGELLRALKTQPFHALHYVGHGAYDREAERGVLLFEDDSGWARPVTGEKLGIILHDFSSLRLAVLNACEGARTARSDPFAGVAGSLVQQDIPAVVAMQFEISDEAAIQFASGFYEPLAAGAAVDASLAAARLAMLAERSDDIEWGTPVLFMRVPDGRIFDLGEDPSAGGSDRSLRALGSRAASTRAPAGAAGKLRVLVNYRRDDTAGHALLLTDRLRQHFGEDNIHGPSDRGGESDRLSEVQGTAVLLAVVGPGWATSLKTSGPSRHSDDFSRREIERALRDRPESVLPVLVDTAMPDPETLPRSLRGLCQRERVELRHDSFDRDLAHLVTRLEALGAGNARSRKQEGERAAVVAGPRPAVIPEQRAAGIPEQGAAVIPQPRPVTARPIQRTRAAAGIPRPYQDHFVDVINGILDGTVVPLLGSGIPGEAVSATHLAAPLAERFDTNSAGLAELAQLVSVTLGERRLYTAIKDLVAAQSEPTATHRFLAELPGLLRSLGVPSRPQLIISASYDSCLERAFEDAGEPFDYSVYVASSGWFVHVPWGEHATGPVATTIVEPRKYVGFPIDDEGQLERTIIVKIHGGADGQEGSVAWRNNYVVTEDDYIDYLPTHNIQDHLPIQILDKLTGSRCLFLGYVLRNWSTRVFLRRIWRGKTISESSWAIEEDPDPIEKSSWSVVGHVELLSSALPEYVETLRSMLAAWRAGR